MTRRRAACPGTLTAGVTRATRFTGGVTGGSLGRSGNTAGVFRAPSGNRAKVCRRNSGKTLKASARTPLWSISGKVYVATADRTVSAFGYPQDRHR